jgi:hypothetical protein
LILLSPLSECWDHSIHKFLLFVNPAVYSILSQRGLWHFFLVLVVTILDHVTNYWTHQLSLTGCFSHAFQSMVQGLIHAVTQRPTLTEALPSHPSEGHWQKRVLHWRIEERDITLKGFIFWDRVLLCCPG